MCVPRNLNRRSTGTVRRPHSVRPMPGRKKRERIVRRDFHLCRACNEGSYKVFGVPGLDQELQVHHIEPLEERFDLRLDDGNLVTLCSMHHRMAEDGDIPRDYLHDLAVTSPGGGRPAARERVKTNSGPLDTIDARNENTGGGDEHGKTSQVGYGEQRKNWRRRKSSQAMG